MSELYPLKFHPVFKEKLWGGNKIREIFGMDFSPLKNCGEAWLLSGYGSDISMVSNGFLAGNALDELIEVYMGDLVGEAVFEKHGTEFPLLIKILDSTGWLSIQVHPGDEMAARLHQGNGKTEMWYVAQADPGARLISGFSGTADAGIYQKHLSAGTLEQIMNYENARQGDVFFMPAGRVHALGPGLLMFEIQQSSDATYRIYDFGRVDDNGNARELHTELAMEAIDFENPVSSKTEYPRLLNQTVPAVQCDYFETRILHFDKPLTKDYSAIDSFAVLQCAEGQCSIEYYGGSETLSAGELLLVPAITESLSIIPGHKSVLLETYVPS